MEAFMLDDLGRRVLLVELVNVLPGDLVWIRSDDGDGYAAGFFVKFGAASLLSVPKTSRCVLQCK
jgi:hypothetical protein